jgi:hypothetical protein
LWRENTWTCQHQHLQLLQFAQIGNIYGDMLNKLLDAQPVQVGVFQLKVLSEIQLFPLLSAYKIIWPNSIFALASTGALSFGKA